MELYPGSLIGKSFDELRTQAIANEVQAVPFQHQA